MSLRIRTIAPVLLFVAALATQAATAAPVTVRSCDRDVIVDRPPQRAVAHGSNLTEIMLALGLEDRMVGYIGRPERMMRIADRFPAIASLRSLQAGYPNLEIFLAEDIDFVFAGWSYGMRVGGAVTPETLGAFGIPVYELTESCIRIGRQERPSLDFLYRDLKNLAAIFRVDQRAEVLIESYRRRVAAVTAAVAARTERPTVFVYDSGDRLAQSAGGFSMPQALIDAAGGVNVLQDVESSWVRVGWETVVDRNPDAVLIVDYGEVTAAQKIAFMKDNPAFASITAVARDHFLVLSYDEMTPGPRNIDAIEKLADFLGEVADSAR